MHSVGEERQDMKCVRCRGQLKLESYEGVEIDRCPQCQGVWLDAGELAKIVGATQYEANSNH